jgi:UDP-N-acetyl-D-glucosamine dehydrogenase
VDGTQLKAVDVTEEELRGANCVLILTDHPEFDYGAVARYGRLIVDTRHAVPDITGMPGRLVRL